MSAHVGQAETAPTAIAVNGAAGRMGRTVAALARERADLQVVGGIDMTIFPRLDWRIAEVSWGSVQNVGTSVKPSTVTTGLVLRLP